MFCTSLFVILTFCFWAFYCLSFLRSLIAPFVLRFTVSICPFRPSIYGLWLPLSSFDLRVSDCPFRPSIYGIWLPLLFFDLQSPIARFVLRFTVSDCPFRPSIYGLWLPLSSFDLQSLITPFVLRFTVSDCPFGPSIYGLDLDLRQIGGFLMLFRFHPPKKLTATVRIALLNLFCCSVL